MTSLVRLVKNVIKQLRTEPRNPSSYFTRSTYPLFLSIRNIIPPNFVSPLTLNAFGKDREGRAHTYPFSWATGRRPAYSDPQEHCTALSRQEPRKAERWLLTRHSQHVNPNGLMTAFPLRMPYLSSSGD